MYILSVFSLLLTIKRENRYKALYIGKQMDIAKKVYNECFIVQKTTRQKTQKLVYMLKIMNNTLN